MRLIDADELLSYWDELWEDHRVTQSELHHIIKDKWSDIHRYTLEELSEKNWHYPSKGEYPISGADVWDGYRVLNYLIDLKKWVYDCEFEVSEPRCWCYLPEPPKEEA